MPRCHPSTLSMLAFCLAASAWAAPPAPNQNQVRTEALARAAQTHLEQRRYELGLTGNQGFQFKHLQEDQGGTAHLRFQQTYEEVPIFGGEAIVHLRNGEVRGLTDGLLRDLTLNPRPSLEVSEALAAVHAAMAPTGPYAFPPRARLVIAPLGESDRAALVYHVHAELENGTSETRHEDAFVDAHTGRVLERWDTLHSTGVTGLGHSQWYGPVDLSTNSVTTGFEMRDLTRGTGGTFGNNVTTNLANGIAGNGTIFTDSDNEWGDGAQYLGAPATTNAQTAAVDGHRGMTATWDFYQRIFGRNGIDDAGTATYSRMHYSSNYDNAFWSDSCFCMTYGDGSPGGSVGEADLDTCGHEMTHGVISRTANLLYRGESGGLNEATSDILGTMVEFWMLAAGGSGTIIPSTAGTGNVKANYKLFENSWGHAAPNDALRWMHRPSRDGRSPDAWSSTLKRLDVHYSSGPANHFFFLLAHGSQVDSLSEMEQSPRANGVGTIVGIGNDKAARIWYRALTGYMTASTTYVSKSRKTASNTALAATLAACDDLIAEGVITSADKVTVGLAWKAVNVQ